MFVVAGVTGQTGRAAAEKLLAEGRPVRALVRDRAKAAIWGSKGAELYEADLRDAGALRAALEGAEGAYLLAPPEVTHPEPLARYVEVAEAVRSAARASGLPKLVFLSSEGAHLPAGTGPIIGLHRAEEVLKDAAERTIFLRATYFQENWQAVFGLAAAQGMLPTMLAEIDAKRPMVSTLDIGETAAELLTAADAPAVVELVGPEPYSSRDVADAMAAALGRPVAPVQPPRDEWVSILVGAGVGEAYAKLIAEMYDAINSGHVRFSGRGQSRAGRVRLRDTIRGWAAKAAA